MKRSELFFTFLFLPLDFLMIILAGISAYYLRFTPLATEIRPVIFNLPFNNYLNVVLLIGLSWLVIFALAGLYRVKRPRSIIEEFYRVILACSTGLVLIVVLIFIFRELFSSRFIVLAGWLLAIIFICIARGSARLIQRWLFNLDIGVHKVVLVGNSKTTDNLIYEFSRRNIYGLKVVKRLRDFSLATAQELTDFVKNQQVDEIIQSDPNLTKAEVLRLYDFSDEHHLTFKFAADLLGTRVLKTDVREIAGVPIVEVKKTSLEGWGRIIKRVFDIILSLFFIIILSPVLSVTALLVKLDSQGPVIYKNLRVGKGGRMFKLYKFRSMLIQYCVVDDNDGSQAALYENELIKAQNSKAGPVYKIQNDPRLTRVGRFIRRWSIDELPQFFNVLAGNVSLIGPRPHQPREVAKYEHHHKKVLTIKPGISGLGQISGRSDLSFEDEVKLDTYYIENWSLAFDLAILLRTPLAVIRRRKVE